MESILQQLSEDERKSLSVLAFFQGCFYYDYRGIKDYLILQKSFYEYGDDPHKEFYPFLKKGIGLGIFQKVNGSYAFMKSHPLLRFHLQRQLRENKTVAVGRKQFHKYYKLIAEDLYKKLKQSNSEQYHEAHEILSFEAQNLLEATINGTMDYTDFETFSSVLHIYYKSKRKLKFWLSFYEYIKLKMESSHFEVPDAIKISLLDSIGNMLIDLRRPEAAEKTYLEALEIVENIGYTDESILKIKSILYTNIGNCSSQLSTQIYWQEKSYDLVKSLSENNYLGQVAYNLSEAYFEINELKKSYKYLNIATNEFLENDNLHLQIKAYKSLSSHYQIIGDYSNARINLRLALAAAQKLEDEFNEGIILQDLAGVYFQNNELDEALVYCKKAIPLFIRADDPSQLANAYNFLSAISFSDNNMTDGLDYAEKAIGLFADSKNYSQMAQTYTNIALKCYKEHWFREAITELKKAIKLYSKIENFYHINKSNILLASCLFGNNQNVTAKSLLLKTLTYFIDVNNAEEIQHCLNLATFNNRAEADTIFESKINELKQRIRQ